MLSRRTLTLAALALPVAAVQARAAPDTLDKIKASKQIRVAIDPNLPPWSFRNTKLQMSGSEYDTAVLLAHDLGVTMTMVACTDASRIPLLLTGKVDLVVAAMTITPEREKVIAFSKPYSGTTVVVAAPAAMNLKNLADLAGKRVAVTRGSIMDTMLTAEAPPATQIVRFGDEATTMTSILSGQLDIVAESTTLNDIINQRDPARHIETKIVLRSDLHGMGMRKQDVALKAWVDAWIKINMGNGKLEAIFKKDQGANLPQAVVKAAEA